jgi:CopG family nickel-responsive transcriptional regulator
MKGTRKDIQHFADHVIAERGVRYGRVVMIPTKGAADYGRHPPHHHGKRSGTD